MNTTIKAASLCAAIALLAGCGSKTPTCGDADSVKLVKQIYQQQFDKEHNAMEEERRKRVLFTVKDTQVSLESITTESRNDSVGKASCSAQLVTSFPEGVVPTEEQWVQYTRAIYSKQGAVLDGNKLSGNVTYTVQRTEDTGELLVSLSGFMPFMSYFHDIAMARYSALQRAKVAAEKVAQEHAAQEQASVAQATLQPEPAAAEAVVQATPIATPVAAPEPAAAAQPVESRSVSVPSLCTADETPVFACSTGKKRASLCLSNASNQLAYRLAPLDGKTEMVYPAKSVIANTAFKQGSFKNVAGKPVAFISFDKGSYRYAVHGSADGAQGIVVEQSGKRIADLHCQAEQLSELGSAKLQRLNLSQDQRALLFP